MPQRLTCPGTQQSLAVIKHFVLTAARQAGLDWQATYRLRLAVDEIATNIIVHGYQARGISGPLRLFVELDENFLTIHLEDDGPRYDPSTATPPPALHQPPEKRPIGGLGIYLALKYVDQFSYERQEDHNHCTFVMARPSVKCPARDNPNPS